MITAEQKAHFDAFGFLMLRQRFTPQEMKKIGEATLEVIKQKAGEEGLSGKRFALMGFMERHPRLYGLVDDDRIHEIPETLLGPDFYLSSTDGHIRSGDTPWHGLRNDDDAGTYGERPSARVCLYFDKLDRENGALRVIPGSHRRPFADHLQGLWSEDDDPGHKAFGTSSTELPCVVLESEPGDVVVFTESVYHGSFGGTARMQLTAQFGANPNTEEEVQHLRNMHDQFNWSLHPHEAYINSDRPRIRRMVSRLVELGFTPMAD